VSVKIKRNMKNKRSSGPSGRMRRDRRPKCPGKSGDSAPRPSSAACGVNQTSGRISGRIRSRARSWLSLNVERDWLQRRIIMKNRNILLQIRAKNSFFGKVLSKSAFMRSKRPHSRKAGNWRLIDFALIGDTMRHHVPILNQRRYSAIWTVLSAAPLRRLSDTIHMLRPCGMVSSARMRPTKVSSLPSQSIASG